MEINADFEARAIVHAGRMAWVNSPMPGVRRRMLDRLGDEVARATSIVEYAPGSAFSAHTHTGGEEFYVLSGVFSDEHGDYPAGSYVRNPPQSAHIPSSAPGCEILVKLWQFDPLDRQHVNIDTAKHAFTDDANRAGVSELPLYADLNETVRLEQYEPGSVVPLGDSNGLELLVLEGGFSLGQEAFEVHSWMRLPKGDGVEIEVGASGAKVWIKSGHLSQTPVAPSV